MLVSMEHISFMFQCQCKTSESRTAVCVTKEGMVLSDDQCDASHKPTITRPCETAEVTACERTSRHWYTSEWDEVCNFFYASVVSREC